MFQMMWWPPRPVYCRIPEGQWYRIMVTCQSVGLGHLWTTNVEYDVVGGSIEKNDDVETVKKYSKNIFSS